MIPRPLLLMSALGALAFFGGCTADCKDACTKIIDDCEAGIPSYNVTQCTAECDAIRTEYSSHDYLESNLELFQDQLDCINAASCEELLSTDAPACYDQYSQLYTFF